MRRKSLLPPVQGAKRRSLGGARPGVQISSEELAARNAPMLASKIYASPSIQSFDQDDPRYNGKSDQVENIYLPAPIVQMNFFDKLSAWWKGKK